MSSSHESPPDGFERFVHQNSTTLLRLAWLLTGNNSDAEDLLQITLAELWSKWARVHRGDSPLAYSRQLMASRYISSRRRRWWSERPSSSLPEEIDLREPAEVIAHRDEVRRALVKLSPQQRAIVVLRFVDDLSVEQTALTLGCSEATVKVQTGRALAKLRQDSSLMQESGWKQ